jgi:hypothetical protein
MLPQIRIIDDVEAIICPNNQPLIIIYRLGTCYQQINRPMLSADIN